MKILQVLPSLNSGGVERCVVEICDYIAKTHQDDEVFVMSKGGWMEMFLDKKCQHIKVNLTTKNPFKIIKNAKVIANFCNKNQIDIVHVHSRAPAWSCYLARKYCKFKLITTVHAAYSAQNFFKKIYNKIMFKGDCVIAVSDFLKNQILQTYNVTNKYIHVIKRGIQIDTFSREKVTSQRLLILANELRLPDDKFIITVPARISRGKGHKELIKALSMLRGFSFLCYFVGDFDKKLKFKKNLDKMIEKLKMEDKIHFTGRMKDMPAMYAVTDLVILPSIKPESFGKVIIEAGAMGCIVLSTNIGNPVDILQNGSNGFLVAAKKPIDMSKKIAEIIHSKIHQDPIKKANISKYFIENFNAQDTCRAEYELYTKVFKS